jgi:hypothetical protein
VTTNASGIADPGAFTADGTAGSYQVTATIGDGNTASFALTNRFPQVVQASSGGGQTTGLGANFGSDLRVIVTAGGLPVANVIVIFSVPTSGRAEHLLADTRYSLP